MRPAMASPRASSRSVRRTFAPSRARVSAQAAPMPAAAPVTSATLPWSWAIHFLRFLSRRKVSQLSAPRHRPAQQPGAEQQAEAAEGQRAEARAAGKGDGLAAARAGALGDGAGDG